MDALSGIRDSVFNEVEKSPSAGMTPGERTVSAPKHKKGTNNPTPITPRVDTTFE